MRKRTHWHSFLIHLLLLASVSGGCDSSSRSPAGAISETGAEIPSEPEPIPGPEPRLEPGLSPPGRLNQSFSQPVVPLSRRGPTILPTIPPAGDEAPPSIENCARPSPETELFPGGFVTAASEDSVRPLLSREELETLLPPAGQGFQFPAPYNTEAVRLTDETDCAGTDCVRPVGYSYWRNINFHLCSQTLFLFLSLDDVPTLFRYHKGNGVLEKLNPLFEGTGLPLYHTGEGMYFSGRQENLVYVVRESRLYRVNVVTKRVTVVFDSNNWFPSGTLIWQTHSSDNDTVHSATLKNASTGEELGCLLYKESRGQWRFFQKVGLYDECQVDRSGRWLLIKEDMNGDEVVDNRIINLGTEAETILSEVEGGVGHSDNGYQVVVGEDVWGELPGGVRLWRIDTTPFEDQLVYQAVDWPSDGATHISYTNARSDLPLSEQYACNSGAALTNSVPRANEIYCYRLDGSFQVLVVAPVMTDMNTGGGGSPYHRLPKGNLDVSGRYFIWTTNHGGNRLDAFLVKIPSHLLY